MFKSLSQLKKLKICLLTLVILLFSISPCFGQNVICYTQDVAAKIVVDLQKAKITDEELILTQNLNDELKIQIESLNQIIELQKEQINILNSANESYKELLKIQKDAYEKQLKKSKPSFIDTVVKTVGFVGVGILIGVLL